MRLGTTYICVEDMEKSLNFYKLLLQKEPLYCNDDRWIAFDCGNQLALYNKKYDAIANSGYAQNEPFLIRRKIGLTLNESVKFRNGKIQLAVPDSIYQSLVYQLRSYGRYTFNRFIHIFCHI